MTPEDYLAAMNRIAETGETPDLGLFRQLVAFDDNTLWRLGPGHAANLLDQALDRIDEISGQLAAAHAAKQDAINRATQLALQLEGTK
jgi:hypothetical protein